MSSMGSTILSVGTLLSRAEEQGTPVRVLVEGNWITGTPIASDSHGVVLDNPDDGQYLVKSTSVTAVVYLREEVYAARTTVTRDEDPVHEPQARTGYTPERRAVGPAKSSD